MKDEHYKTNEEKMPQVVDLGLPSGTKWASCNVGASHPWEYGGYYAWGETEEKEVYNDVTYQHFKGEDSEGRSLPGSRPKWCRSAHQDGCREWSQGTSEPAYRHLRRAWWRTQLS